MTTPRGPQAVIDAALQDWWLTADPTQPPTTAEAAERVEMYLLSSGYTITPDTRRNPPVPRRRAIATVLAVALVCIASTIGAGLHHEWGWTVAGTLVTGLLTREAVLDLSSRRQGRSDR